MSLKNITYNLVGLVLILTLFYGVTGFDVSALDELLHLPANGLSLLKKILFYISLVGLTFHLRSNRKKRG